jgi:hypothetical protein
VSGGAYAAMSPREFDGINARQRWANWRVIPRNLRGRRLEGPLAAIDLCCGGTSGADLVAIFVRLGFAVLGRARSCVFDRYWQHCFCAEAGPTS